MHILWLELASLYRERFLLSSLYSFQYLWILRIFFMGCTLFLLFLLFSSVEFGAIIIIILLFPLSGLYNAIASETFNSISTVFFYNIF